MPTYCISSKKTRGSFSFLRPLIQRSHYIDTKKLLYKIIRIVGIIRIIKGWSFYRKYGKLLETNDWASHFLIFGQNADIKK